ncbi:MAG: hypothetical protein JNL10_08925 [Verrucomicrobiales bacterium]|nr:hypothetical protein [Verrucomicrobiales bacterium]
MARCLDEGGDAMTGLWLLQGLMGLGLFLVIQAVRQGGRLPGRSSAISWVLLGGCLLVPRIPVGGLSLAQWVAGFSPGCSIPLLAVAAHAAIRALGGPPLFRPQELQSLWILGVVLGVVLYPASLGWGTWDPYAEGWGRSWIFLVLGVVAAVFLLLGVRSGYVLLAAILAWRLGALESTNYWDYLVDPQFFLIALICLAMGAFARARANPAAAAGSEAKKPLNAVG